jgi:hypothetical protein
MAKVEIPNIPSEPRDLEDYVAALFQSAGFFVERNVVETDVLELDVVATSFDQPIPAQVLIEVKSGRWHFRDIFTVLGQMKYLGIEKGAFCVKDLEGKDPAEIQKRIDLHRIAFIHFGDFSDAAALVRKRGIPQNCRPAIDRPMAFLLLG